MSSCEDVDSVMRELADAGFTAPPFQYLIQQSSDVRQGNKRENLYPEMYLDPILNRLTEALSDCIEKRKWPFST